MGRSDVEKSIALLCGTESLLKTILKSSSDLIFVKDLGLRTVVCNESYARATGRDIHEIIGKSDIEIGWSADLVKGDPARGIRGYEADDLEVLGGNTLRIESEQARIGNEIRYYDTIKSPLRNDAGEVIGLLGISRDVTEFKRVEQVMRRQAEEIEDLYNNAPTGYHSLNADQVIMDMNGTELGWLGYSREEVVGRMKISELLTPESVEIVSKAYPIYRSSGRLRNLELQMVRKDGSCFPVLVSAASIRDKEGNYLRSLSTVYDITEHKRIEEEKSRFSEISRKLKKAESLGRMAGAIAHHFNNRLHAVMMGLDLALDDPQIPGSTRELLDITRKEARKGAEMSSQMLVYLGQVPARNTEVDLLEACRAGLECLRAAVPANVRLTFEFSGWEPAEVNPGDVQQILSILVANAWEALESNAGEIRVRLSREAASEIRLDHKFPIDWQPLVDAYACLEVADSGCGIEEASFESLFEPFYTTKFPGRGMGLPMLVGILQQRQGVCTVESRVGSGTSFKVYWPLLSDGVPRGMRSATLTAAEKSSCGILLIDDDPEVLRLSGKTLQRLGYEVFEAPNGTDAIELYREHQSDIRIVLCDIVMPHMSGWEVLAGLRLICPTVQVVLMSGFPEELECPSGAFSKPQAFLHKPFHADALKKVLDDVLSASKAH